MKISLRQFWVFLIGFLVLIFSVLELFYGIPNDSSWVNKTAAICVMQCIYCIFAWHYLGFSFFTPKTLFLVFLILFHEGNIFVQAWMPLTAEEERIMMLNRYGQTLAFEAAHYVIIFIFVYILLVVLLSHKSNTIGGGVSITKYDTKMSYRLKLMGRILLAVVILPTLYTDFRLFIGRSVEGYVGVYNTDVSFYGIPLGYFTKMFYPAVVLLLVGNKNNKKKFTVVMLMVLAYYIARMMLIGRKADSILAILPIVGIYVMYYKPKIRILSMVGGYGFVYLCALATKLRGVPIDSNFGTYLLKTIQTTSPINDILYEMGGTIKAIMQIMMAIPSTGMYRCGITYLWAPIGGVLLGLKNPIQSVSVQTQMDLFLALPERGSYINSTVASMGGSAIAEWYFNFGWIGILLLPLFVIAILKFDAVYAESASKDLTFVYANIFLYYLLRYSRQYVIELVWNPLFCIAVVALLNWVIAKRNNISVNRII